MAVLTYKGGKYRNLAGNKIFDGEKWLDISGDSKIFLNGKWRNFSWMTGSTDIPEGESPVYPGVPGPELTEETLVHVPSEKPEGTVLYVTPVGSGTKDGTSWENAFSASQIHVALLSCKDGDSVFMSEGDFGKLDRPMVIPADVSIYGGFPVSDPAWENRNGFTFSTIWQGNKTFPPFVCAGSQHTIDGISFKDFSGEATDSQSAFIRNCSFSGGDFSFSGAMNNCKAADCSVSIGGNAERVVIVNAAASDFLVTGNVNDATLFLSGGKFKAADVDAAYICNCDTEVKSLSGSTVVEGKLTAESVETSFIAGTVQAFAETVKNCTVLESSTLFAEVSESALYNCKSSVGDTIANCRVTNGSIAAIEARNDFPADYLSIDKGWLAAYTTKDGYRRLKEYGFGWTELVGYNDQSLSSDMNLATVLPAVFGIRNGRLYRVEFALSKVSLVDNSVRWENIRAAHWHNSQTSLIENEVAAMVKDGKLFTAIVDKAYIYDDRNYELLSDNIICSQDYAALAVIADGKPEVIKIYSDGTIEHRSGFTDLESYKYKQLFVTPTTYYTIGVSCVTDDDSFVVSGSGYEPRKVRSVVYGPMRDDVSKYDFCLCLEDGRISTVEGTIFPFDYDKHKFIKCFGHTDLYAVTESGELYWNHVFNGNYINLEKVTDLTGWETIWDGTGGRSAYGICNNSLFHMSYNGNSRKVELTEYSSVTTKAANCNIVNCDCRRISGRNSKFINCISTQCHSEANTLFVNCRGDVSEAAYSTIVNSDGSLKSGSYNVFWNNNGTAPAANNAQSAYSSENILTLGSNNDIARFESTGYSPAMGPQDAGVCPDPVTDPEGYNAYIDSFGDWQPKNNSFLIGKGVRLEDVPTDIEGTERPETPTLGAYEPKPEVSE